MWDASRLIRVHSGYIKTIGLHTVVSAYTWTAFGNKGLQLHITSSLRILQSTPSRVTLFADSTTLKYAMKTLLQRREGNWPCH